MEFTTTPPSPFAHAVLHLIAPFFVSALVWVLCRPSLPARPFLGGLALVPTVVCGFRASLLSIAVMRAFPPDGSFRAILANSVWAEYWPALLICCVSSLSLLLGTAVLYHRRHRTWPPSTSIRTLPLFLLLAAAFLQAIVLGVALWLARPLPFAVLFPGVAAGLSALSYASLALLLAAVATSLRRLRPQTCA